MTATFTRAQVLERLHAKASSGSAIIGGGAGSGLSPVLAGVNATGMGYDVEVAMNEAGADIVVCPLGLTVGGTIGALSSPTLDESTELRRKWSNAAHAVRDAHVLKHTAGVHGFYGAPSLERTPAETAITGQTPGPIAKSGRRESLLIRRTAILLEVQR